LKPNMKIENPLTNRLIGHRYLLLSVLCGLLYLANLGGYRLFDVDEPRYAETARFMVASGDYIVPRFNGAYRFEKPVLTYWLIAAGYRLFGVGEWAARLPSALAGLGTVLLTCLLAGRIRSPGRGLAAGAILACCLQFIALGRWVLTDMHLCFFFTGCLVFFYLGQNEGNDSKARLYFLGAFAFSGFSVLTKGPVGLVLPAAISAAFLFSTGQLHGCLRRIPITLGISLFAAITLPWYVLVTIRSDFEFFRVFILQHNFLRFFGEVAPGGQHIEPFYYYLPWLLAGSYPWTFFALQSVFNPLRPFIRAFGKAQALQGNGAFPLVWTLLVILFFSLSRAKLPTYITPAFPPLAVLLADYLAQTTAVSPGRRPLRLVVPAILGVVFALGLGVYLLAEGNKLAPFSLGNLPYAAAAVILAGPLAAFSFLLTRRLTAAFSLQITGQILFTWLLAFSVLPLVSGHRQEPQIRLIDKADEIIGDRGRLAAYRYHKTALAFYSEKPVMFLEPGETAALDTLNVPFAVITIDRYAEELTSRAPYLKLISSAEHLVLLGQSGN